MTKHGQLNRRKNIVNDLQNLTYRATMCILGILIITIYFCPVLQAQGSFWESPDAYLGQPRPSDTPEIFAPGLLADAGTFTYDRIAFSRDGKEIIYAQNDKWYNLEHGMVKSIRYVDHKWDKPT